MGPGTSSFRTSRTVQRKLRMEGQHARSLRLKNRAWQRQMNVIDVRIARCYGIDRSCQRARSQRVGKTYAAVIVERGSDSGLKKFPNKANLVCP